MHPAIVDLNNCLVTEWKLHLEAKGVKFTDSPTRIHQLLCLFHFFPNPVSQNEMDQWIRDFGGQNDRQARHLAWDGWYIQTGNRKSTRMEVSHDLSSDQLQLVSITEANPIWVKHNFDLQKEQHENPEFFHVKKIFSKRGCSMCGYKSDSLQSFRIENHTSNQINIVPLCNLCILWCDKYSIKLVLSKRLIARPLMEDLQ